MGRRLLSLTRVSVLAATILTGSLDSTDATGWRRTVLTDPSMCEPAAPDPVPVPAGARLFASFHELEAASCAGDPLVTSGRVGMLSIDVQSARVVQRTTIAPLHGVGEAVESGLLRPAGDPHSARRSGAHERWPDTDTRCRSFRLACDLVRANG
jgi:hypothetical protein